MTVQRRNWEALCRENTAGQRSLGWGPDPFSKRSGIKLGRAFETSRMPNMVTENKDDLVTYLVKFMHLLIIKKNQKKHLRAV